MKNNAKIFSVRKKLVLIFISIIVNLVILVSLIIGFQVKNPIWNHSEELFLGI